MNVILILNLILIKIIQKLLIFIIINLFFIFLFFTLLLITIIINFAIFIQGLLPPITPVTAGQCEALLQSLKADWEKIQKAERKVLDKT